MENSQELQFLYDYNQLRFSFCFITLGKTERADLPRPHRLTHLQVIEPASHIIFFFKTLFLIKLALGESPLAY